MTATDPVTAMYAAALRDRAKAALLAEAIGLGVTRHWLNRHRGVCQSAPCATGRMPCGSHAAWLMARELLIMVATGEVTVR